MRIRWHSPRVRNLALGRPYTIGAQWPDTLFTQTERQQYPDAGQLTDGHTGSLNARDPGWVGLLRQYGRSIVIDLGGIQDVRSVELRFLQNLRAGIQFPCMVRFYASIDGASWHFAGSCGDQASWYAEAPQIQSFATDLHGNARYIRVQFTAKVYSFMDECYVYGRPGPDRDADPWPGAELTELMGVNYLVDPHCPDAGGALQIRHAPAAAAAAAASSPDGSGPAGPAGKTRTLASADPAGISRTLDPSGRAGMTPTLASTDISGFPATRHTVLAPVDRVGEEGAQPGAAGDQGDQPGVGYLTSQHPESGGVNHMQLVYTGSGEAAGTWSGDDFIPMVAQIESDGRPVRWLFDATLFGPYGKMPTSAAAWSGWLHELFSPGVNLDALDQTVGQLKRTFADSEFREKVVLTLPSTTAGPSDFGAIGAGMKSLNMNPGDIGPGSAVVNKLTALRWIMREALKRWREADPRHLRLAGFYWRPESVNVNDPYDPWLIERMAAAVHAEGLLFYWIPFYGSAGVTVARQLGFDAVMIQPNVSFNWNIDARQRLRSVSEMAQFYHAGVEIELHWDITSRSNPAHVQTALSRYEDYFTAGTRHGYGGRVTKAYYLNSKSLVQCSRSADQLPRQAYADTVAFVCDEWNRTDL
ncbi:MAG: DUF4855 domain-containing protein [Bacilli bacterium]